MLQLKDPAIKLFGKTIPCASVTATLCGEALEGSYGSNSDRDSSSDKDLGAPKDSGLKKQGEDDLVNPKIENLKTPSIDEETENGNGGGSNLTEETNSNEKAPLKKPDKILPCPRCHSMDTKFCYYNNYNVHQPRHFCKGCQRYWTAGGAMRNVPVGAGRRKSKNCASQNRFITISEVLQASGVGSPNGVAVANGHPGLKCGSVITVRSDATVSASTGSVSNLREMPFLDSTRSLTEKGNEQGVTKSRKIGEMNSCGSSVSAPIESGSNQCAQASYAPIVNGCLAQMACIPAWPYPWNTAIPPNAFPHPGFVLPFVPPTYWNCAVPNTWNAPWFLPQPPSQNTKDLNSNPNSNPSVLGKHSREGEMLQKDSVVKQESPKQASVLTPKTLRIDHPEEAAKSSIWETLGIKNETNSKRGLFFKDLKSKDSSKINPVPEKLDHLAANPAALCRALNFHEVS